MNNVACRHLEALAYSLRTKEEFAEPAELATAACVRSVVASSAWVACNADSNTTCFAAASQGGAGATAAALSPSSSASESKAHCFPFPFPTAPVERRSRDMMDLVAEVAEATAGFLLTVTGLLPCTWPERCTSVLQVSYFDPVHRKS